MSLRLPDAGGRIAGAVLAAVCFLSTALLAFAADMTAPGTKSPAVTVVKARKLCFDNTIDVTGVLVPKTEFPVRPDREGLQVVKVLVEPGTKVSAGQSLAQLAPALPSPGSGDIVSVAAPVAGTVFRSRAIVGAMAPARGEPLFQIIAGSDIELSAQITTRNLSNLAAALGASSPSVRVKIVGVGELPGHVQLVSSAVDPATQLGEVRIAVAADERLKPGAFGRAVINAGQRCDGAAIPLSALLYGPEGTVAQVVRDERVESRLVTVGLEADGNVEILRGISEGDPVVARAGAFLRDGDRVRSFVAGEPSGRR
jgi:multidrug efflux pump subunit AcrA (membrane-fusion protein)